MSSDTSQGGPPGNTAGGGLGGACANHPSEFAESLCARCGDFICARCEHLTSTGEIFCPRCYDDHAFVGEALEWERRHELGMVVAFFASLKRFFFSPVSFFSGIDPEGGYASPIWYTMICVALNTLGSAVMFGVQFMKLGEMTGSPGIPIGEFGTAYTIGMLVLTPVWTLIALFIVSGLIHLACMVVGADNYGYRATFRLFTYTTGLWLVYGVLTFLMGLVMLLGAGVLMGVMMFISVANLGVLVYWLVLVVIGVHKVQNATVGQSIGAVAVLIGMGVLMYCLCLGGMFAFMGASLASF